MPQAAKAALTTEPAAPTDLQDQPIPANSIRFRLAQADQDRKSPLRPVAISTPRKNEFHFKSRSPAITGEANFRGVMPIDGVISGALHTSGGAFSLRQRPRRGSDYSEPELDGEITFKEMLRVNGHVAGKVRSLGGTLIVAPEAQVDGDIDVSVAVINGVVNGDVTGREKVELAAGAVIRGNILTRSLSMKPGAVFHGDCRMLREDERGN